MAQGKKGTGSAHRGKKQRRGLQKGVAGVLVGVLLVGVLGAALLASPDAQAALDGLFGIEQAAVVPPAEEPRPEQSAGGSAQNTTAHVHFIDVGQGDAVLLEDGGEWALLDAGPPEGQDGLLAYLKAAGVDAFRYVVMTHPHADHIGGMRAVVEAYPIGTVLLPDLDKAPYPTTATFEKLLQAMVDKGLSAKTMRAGDEYSLGAGMLSVLADGVDTDDNYNLLSPALLFVSGKLRFLDTGDGEKADEKELLAAGVSVRANLYKAAHHGSTTSNTQAFLEAVQPEVAVICCGAGNSYGHPHREVLQRFEELGMRVLRTDTDGSVVAWAAADGKMHTSTAVAAQNGAKKAA